MYTIIYYSTCLYSTPLHFIPCRSHLKAFGASVLARKSSFQGASGLGRCLVRPGVLLGRPREAKQSSGGKMKPRPSQVDGRDMLRRALRLRVM